jgi:hypothetical protein
MWLLRNHTSYAAERNWTRDEHGVHWYLIAVRGTFTIGPRGRPALHDEQPPPILAPEYTGTPGESSLRYDSELLERKPGTDVVVLGSAYAPRGRPASTVPVILRVGKLEKQLLVHGNRAYYEGVAGLATTSSEPFVKQPIQYELAFGGRDTSDPDPRRHKLDERNPIGRGFPPSAARWKDQLAHCIEYPDGAPASRGPAGFGPIDRSWLPRRALAGTFDAKWIDSKKPLLPDDYDPKFGMCAPADQQLPAPLVGGEQIGLLNMTPDGTLAFELPKVALRFSTAIRGKRHEHRAQISSVVVEPCDRRVFVTWQSSLKVRAPDVDFLSTTDITEQGGTH